jgi:hypothetical protein
MIVEKAWKFDSTVPTCYHFVVPRTLLALHLGDNYMECQDACSTLNVIIYQKNQLWLQSISPKHRFIMVKYTYCMYSCI